MLQVKSVNQYFTTSHFVYFFHQYFITLTKLRKIFALLEQYIVF